MKFIGFTFTAPAKVFVKALRDNVFTGERTLAKGEVHEVPDHVAKYLFDEGLAQFVAPPTVAERAATMIGRGARRD